MCPLQKKTPSAERIAGDNPMPGVDSLRFLVSQQRTWISKRHAIARARPTPHAPSISRNENGKCFRARKNGRAAARNISARGITGSAPRAVATKFRRVKIATIDAAGRKGGSKLTATARASILLARYAPAGVLLDADFDIVQYRGDTQAYLAPMFGRASLNVLKMMREELLEGVRGAPHKARRGKASVRQNGLHMRNGNVYRDLNVMVTTLLGDGSGNLSYLLLIKDSQPGVSAPTRPDEGRGLPGVSPLGGATVGGLAGFGINEYSNRCSRCIRFASPGRRGWRRTVRSAASATGRCAPGPWSACRPCRGRAFQRA